MNHLETGALRVPSGEALRVLGGHTRSSSIRSTEDDRNVDGAGGHIEGLGGRIDNLVDGLHGEVKGHELTDRAQPIEGGSNGDSSETHFGDGGVDDPTIAVFLP